MPDRTPLHRSGRGVALLWVAAAGCALGVAGTSAWHLQADLRASREDALARRAEVSAPAPAHAPLHEPRPAVAARLPGDPRRLMIFRLGVDAPVVPVRATGGRLLPPLDGWAVGWWAGGVRPGEPDGAALLVGHRLATGESAFEDLDRVRPGDAVLVRSDAGVVRYAVARVRSYPRGRVLRRTAAELGRSGDGDLVLLTCEDWDGHRYRSDLVVTATPR